MADPLEELGDELGDEINETQEIESQFQTGSVLSYVMYFPERTGATAEVGVRVRNQSGPYMIWDHPIYGEWDAQQWAIAGSQPTGSWVFFASGTG